MLVGVDADKLYAVKDKGVFMVLEYARKHGFDGVFYRTMLDISPTLDAGELKEIKAHADSLGLYVDSGAGWVNPNNTAETPHIRRFGKGDYKLAMEMMIKAASEISCRELYAVSGHSIHGDPFFVAYDRFRTDVSWRDQMLAMKKFINMLKPLLKDVAEFERLAKVCEDKILKGELMGIAEFNKLPFSDEDRIHSYKKGADYLRKIIKENGLN